MWQKEAHWGQNLCVKRTEDSQYAAAAAEVMGSEFSLEDLGGQRPQTGLNEMEIKALLIKVIIIKIVAAVYRKATKFLVLTRNKIS